MMFKLSLLMHKWMLNQGNDIINIEQVPELEIALLDPGIYTLYQIVYEEVEGLVVGANLNVLEGCYELSNGISITILSADESDCTTEVACELASSLLSADVDTVCIEDMSANTVTLTVENLGNESEAIIRADENGVIQELSADRIFEITSVGEQYFYHINYVDTVQIFGGTNIQDLIGCYALSTPVVVTGEDNCFVEPCSVEAAQASTNGQTNLCSTDDTDDLVIVSSAGGNGEQQLFLLLESESTSILESNDTGEFVFDENRLGEFEIVVLNYNEPFVLTADIGALEGCFALSPPLLISNLEDNCEVEPSSCLNDGGMISYNGPTGICGNDGQNDILDISVDVIGGSNRAFLLVNEIGIIINVAPALVILNNPFPEGNYSVYALSYEDFPAGLSANANLNDFTDLCGVDK